MKAVIQRVSRAHVMVDGKKVSEIQKGILTLLGIEQGDQNEQMQKLIQKICELRIFEDENGKMNLSLKDVQGEHLIVSQFTLCAGTKSGRRPSFTSAEKPELAKDMYERSIELSRSLGVRTQGGQFQADMKVELVNDGPVTLIL